MPALARQSHSIVAVHPLPGFTSAGLERDAFLCAIVAAWLVHYRQGQRMMAPVLTYATLSTGRLGSSCCCR